MTNWCVCFCRTQPTTSRRAMRRGGAWPTRPPATRTTRRVWPPATPTARGGYLYPTRGGVVAYILLYLYPTCILYPTSVHVYYISYTPHGGLIPSKTKNRNKMGLGQHYSRFSCGCSNNGSTKLHKNIFFEAHALS